MKTLYASYHKITLSFLLTFFFIAATDLNAQIINTISGTGVSGNPLNGDTALKVAMGKPTTIRYGKNKALYYTDLLNHRIFKIDSNGIVSLVAGNGTPGFSGDGGPATLASLNEPWALIINKKNEIVFCDHLNHRVRKIDTAGIITTIAGDGTQAFGGDGQAATLAQLNTPRGTMQDSKGNYFIADQYNNRIRKIDTNGIITTIMGGLPGFLGDGGPATAAQLNRPTSIIQDKKGQMYITDANNYCIRMIDTAGIAHTIAGDPGNSGFMGDGGSPLAARFAYLSSVAISPIGDIIIADAGNARIRRIRNNKIQTIAGDGTPGFLGDGGDPINCRFNEIAGITLDKDTNLVICDRDNFRIRKIKDYNKIKVGIKKESLPFAKIWCFGSQLHYNALSSGRLQLFGVDGKLVLDTKIEAGTGAIDLHDLKGLLIYSFTGENGGTAQGKIVAGL